MSEATLFSGSIPANYDRLLGPYLFEPYALDLAERLKNDKCKQVLELACGTGRVTRHLVEVLGEDGKIIATDINGDMVTLAKTKVVDARVEWRVADAQALPFDNNSFDHVICQFGVMFFPDKLKAFAEAYRVLTENGRFVFNTWGSLNDNKRARLVQEVLNEVLKDESPDFLQKGPYSFYDTDVVKDLVTEVGFKDVLIEPVKKVIEYETKEEYIDGFLDGTPLTTFLQKKDISIREAIKQKLSEAIQSEYGDSSTSEMLAFVCSGVKK